MCMASPHSAGRGCTFLLMLLVVVLSAAAPAAAAPGRWSVAFLSPGAARHRTSHPQPLYAAKGGKKHKTSRKRTGSADPEDEDDGSGGGGGDDGEAPRVSSQINIPVRRQIAFVKQMKKLMKQEDRPNAPVGKKARKKKDPTQRPVVPADYASFDPSMCTNYLLVDGYNVIKYVHTWCGRPRRSDQKCILSCPLPLMYPPTAVPGPR